MVVLGLATLSDSISVYIGPDTREREKEERKDRGESRPDTREREKEERKDRGE